MKATLAGNRLKSDITPFILPPSAFILKVVDTLRAETLW
jgi:hypothetical protein